MSVKPHPRIRKTIKWGGAAASAVLLILWGISGWWIASWIGSSWLAGFTAGGVQIGFADYKGILTGEGLCHGRLPDGARWKWLPEFHHDPVEWGILIPFWILVLATLCLTIIAWRMEMTVRSSLNACRVCGYDRAGLARGAVCPECGAAPRASAP